MRLLDELRAEHVLIDRVAGSLRTFAAARERGEGEPADGAAFRRFFRLWAGAWHHAREEETLFPALASKAELSPEHGPIAAFVEQHRDMAKVLDELDPLLDRDLSEGEGRRLVELVTAYTRELGRHIDAENSVLLPESEVRLRQANVLELEGRPPTDEELAAREDGERLAAAWPFTADAGGVRGEGCVVCPSYGTTCRGVEAEWWNDSEWEEFSDHLG